MIIKCCLDQTVAGGKKLEGSDTKSLCHMGNIMIANKQHWLLYFANRTLNLKKKIF